MKRVSSIFIGTIISLSCLNTSSWMSAQQPVSQNSNVTLYSVIKHRGEQRKSCINFKIAATGLSRVPCDLRYGSLYAGDELDWFESSTAEGGRSVIKDLGEHDWSTWFEVPVVEPLAKLKPGEQRQVTIDTSGADGAPGKPGAPAASIVRSSNERSSSDIFRSEGRPVPEAIAPNVWTPQPSVAPRHDGKPKIDPLFVKALPGHVYVIHVVDDSRDFYALFRVDELQSGDYCSVSWKLIPEPVNQSGKSASR
jgi:hypothetical protein